MLYFRCTVYIGYSDTAGAFIIIANKLRMGCHVDGETYQGIIISI